MNARELEPKVLKALIDVAPEVDEAKLDRTKPFREQLDIDSIDLLRFVIALSKLAGGDIPERDYGQLTTIEACAKYVAEHSLKQPS